MAQSRLVQPAFGSGLRDGFDWPWLHVAPLGFSQSLFRSSMDSTSSNLVLRFFKSASRLRLWHSQLWIGASWWIWLAMTPHGFIRIFAVPFQIINGLHFLGIGHKVFQVGQQVEGVDTARFWIRALWWIWLAMNSRGSTRIFSVSFQNISRLHLLGLVKLFKSVSRLMG